MRRSCSARWSTRSRRLLQPWTRLPSARLAMTCSLRRARSLRRTCSCPPPCERPGRCRCTARGRRRSRPAGSERQDASARPLCDTCGRGRCCSVFEVRFHAIHLARYHTLVLSMSSQLSRKPVSVLGHYQNSIFVLCGIAGNASDEKKICASVVFGLSPSMRLHPYWPSLSEVFTVGAAVE